MILNNVPFGSTYSGAMSLSATIAWATQRDRRYIVTSGTGLISQAAAPTTFAQLIELTVPAYADVFGVEIVTSLNSGTGPVDWDISKLECWALGDGLTTSNLTMTLDSGNIGAPFVYSDNLGANLQSCFSRRIVDVTGGDVQWVEDILTRTGQLRAKRAVTMFFSPFPAANPPLIGHYRKIYMAWSFQPDAAADIAANYTLTFRPLAGGINTRLA